MIYDTLGFTLHKKCTASCEICCFGCNPNSEEELDNDIVKNYIHESKSIDMIKNIAFTGGEPFLYYDKLKTLIKYANGYKKRTSVVTNGFWATSYEKTCEILKELKECGLEYLSVSHDHFHQKFVSTEKIKNLLKAACSVNLPISLSIVKMKNENVGDIINELGDSIYTSSIKIGPCLPVGNAVKNYDESKYYKMINSKDCRCSYSGNIVLGFNNKIYPCCSQVVMDTNLSIGNAKNLSLNEALFNLKNNMILYYLRNNTMKEIIEFAESKGIVVPKMVVNPCEVCKILFNKDINLNIYKEFFNNKFNSKKAII